MSLNFGPANDVLQNVFYETAGFLHWLKLEVSGSKLIKFSIGQKISGLLSSTKVFIDRFSHQRLHKYLNLILQPINFNCSHDSCFTPDRKQSKKFTVIDLCFYIIIFAYSKGGVLSNNPKYKQ